MELERNESIPTYAFDLALPDGTVSQIDFSAAGEFGDFAFFHHPETDQRQYFYAYHTNTADIFEYFISTMSSQPDADQQLAKLTAQLQKFDQSDMVQTRSSESRFHDYHLEQIRDMVKQNHQATSYSSSDLVLKNDQGYTLCTMPEHDRSVEIPHHQAWQFVAGIIWRSYGEPGDNYSLNSRHSTDTFKSALAAVAEGLLARDQA